MRTNDEGRKNKNAYTTKIIIFAVCLLIYWIILMLIYEKDKKYMVNNLDEGEIFKKYNPMLAGCIQGSRNILARDIIAVILGLINNKNIKLEIRSSFSGKDNYQYIFPIAMGLLYLPINLIIIIRHKINKSVQRVTGQKVATTTISILIVFVIIIILTAIFASNKYIVSDEVLMCIATILILTDNLMLKNNVMMIEDYSKLNTLKYKIESYSIMEDKDIEQIVLWEKYLSYAVSFGVANTITKRIKGLYLDDDLNNLIKNDVFSEFITSDYYYFYDNASLDRRFAKAYGKATKRMLENMGSSERGGGGFSSRWWRRIFWRKRLLGRRRTRRRSEEHSSSLEIFLINSK